MTGKIKDFDEFFHAAKHVQFSGNLMEFAKESNRIEGITSQRENDRMLEKLYKFLKLEKLTVENVCEFNEWGMLRDKEGMDVMVGSHIPSKGGMLIGFKFSTQMAAANDPGCCPYLLHCSFEKIHPFMDGNGRTGRAIWLWQMVNHHDYDLSLGFLHKWYYQSLND